MSFEFGFAKRRYNEDNPSLDPYFFWCGREHYDLYKAFSLLGTPVLVAEDEYMKFYEYEIDVEKLNFIPLLFEQLYDNKHYEKIVKLCLFDDGFVQTYIDSLPIEEKADLRLAFILDHADDTINRICVELFNVFEYGSDIITALYNAYIKMLEDGVKTVWLYGD